MSHVHSSLHALKSSLLPLLAAGLLAALVAPASAGSADDCNRFDDPKLQVRGCTEFIRQGVLEPKLLSIAYTNRGIAYGNQRKTKLAIADFTEAIKLDDTVALPYYNRGNAYFDEKKLDLAVADFSAAIVREPEFALAYFNRGLIEEKLRQHDKSIADYQKALSLDPTMNEALQGLERQGAKPAPMEPPPAATASGSDKAS